MQRPNEVRAFSEREWMDTATTMCTMRKKKLEEHAFGAVSDIGDLTTFYYMQNRESMMPPLDGESTNE